MTISKAAVQTMETVLKLNLIFVQIEVNVTKFLVELRFFLKFNLFLLPILLAGFGATSYVVWRQISTDAEQEALDKARVMLETATAMRTYTTKQIAQCSIATSPGWRRLTRVWTESSTRRSPTR